MVPACRNTAYAPAETASTDTDTCTSPAHSAIAQYAWKTYQYPSYSCQPIISSKTWISSSKASAPSAPPRRYNPPLPTLHYTLHYTISPPLISSHIANR